LIKISDLIKIELRRKGKFVVPVIGIWRVFEDESSIADSASKQVQRILSLRRFHWWWYKVIWREWNNTHGHAYLFNWLNTSFSPLTYFLLSIWSPNYKMSQFDPINLLSFTILILSKSWNCERDSTAMESQQPQLCRAPQAAADPNPFQIPNPFSIIFANKRFIKSGCCVGSIN
jgi:hypothetical protein